MYACRRQTDEGVVMCWRSEAVYLHAGQNRRCGVLGVQGLCAPDASWDSCISLWYQLMWHLSLCGVSAQVVSKFSSIWTANYIVIPNTIAGVMFEIIATSEEELNRCRPDTHTVKVQTS